MSHLYDSFILTGTQEWRQLGKNGPINLPDRPMLRETQPSNCIRAQNDGTRIWVFPDNPKEVDKAHTFLKVPVKPVDTDVAYGIAVKGK